MIDWEKGHIDRKRKRNREKLGLPAEDYENNNLSSVGEKTKSHEEDQKRRQEAYERWNFKFTPNLPSLHPHFTLTLPFFHPKLPHCYNNYDFQGACRAWRWTSWPTTWRESWFLPTYWSKSPSSSLSSYKSSKTIIFGWYASQYSFMSWMWRWIHVWKFIKSSLRTNIYYYRG